MRQHCGAPTTEKWLQLTGQDVNVGKSTVWTLDSDAGQPIQLLGVPIPEETEFRSLGIGIRVPPARGRVLCLRTASSEAPACCGACCSSPPSSAAPRWQAR